MRNLRQGISGGIVAMLLGVGLAGSSAQAAPITVIEENFQRSDWAKPVGTAPNVTNVPGGTWTKTAGYSGTEPEVPFSGWGGTSSKMLLLGSGSAGGGANVGVAVPLTGYAPTSISADAEMLWSNNNGYGTLALGFYGATLPAANTSGVGYLTGFTGVAATRAGTLTLYENGVVVGSSVSTGTNMSWTSRTLSYDVDTATGAISNVTWGGSAVVGLSATTAFTTSATKNAAVVAFDSGGGHSVTVVDNVKVMGDVVPEPSSMLALGILPLLGRRRRA